MTLFYFFVFMQHIYKIHIYYRKLNDPDNVRSATHIKSFKPKDNERSTLHIKIRVAKILQQIRNKAEFYYVVAEFKKPDGTSTYRTIIGKYYLSE